MARSSDNPSQRRTLSLDQTYVLIALAPIVLRVLIMPVAPNDFWWHMAYGRLIANTGSIPAVDHFSYTQNGVPFYDQSWISQLLFYGLNQIGGVPLVLVAQALCVALAYGLLLWLCIRRTQRQRLCVGVLLLGIMPMSFDNWQVRPQTFALPFFVAYLVILSGYRLRWRHMDKALWLLPLLMAVWVNLHGSFEQGLALILITLIGEALRRRLGDDEALTWPEWNRLALCCAVTAAATLVNPRSINIYHYVHDVLRHTSTQFSSEWAPPSLKQFTDVYFFLFVIFLAVVMFRARPRPSLTDWLIVLPFLAVALKSGRSIMWFGIVAMPLLALALTNAFKSWMPDAKPAATPSDSKELSDSAANTMNAAVVVVVWLAVLATLPWIKPSLGLPPQLGSVVDPQTPVKMTVALRRLPQSLRPHRLFHSEASGSYLAWAAPEQKVFLDPRFELYPPQQWRDFNDLKRGLKVEPLIAKYNFDGMMLDKKDNKELIATMKRLNGWSTVYERPGAVLMVRAAR